jgi:hypothetical protein
LSLSPYPKAQALVRLARNSFNWNILGTRGFTALSTIIDGADCYELSHGDLEGGLRALEGLQAADVPAGAVARADQGNGA